MRKPDRTCAERQHWARWRERHGRVAVTVYFDSDFLEQLIEDGILSPEQASDPHLRARILGNWIDRIIK